MIRPAHAGDVPGIVDMVDALRRATRQPQEIDRARVAAALEAMTVWVVEIEGQVRGFLAASVAPTLISAEPVAWEAGWWCSAPGWGERLRLAFEGWARAQGCRLVRMSAPPAGRARRILEAAGYEAVEVAMVKAL